MSLLIVDDEPDFLELITDRIVAEDLYRKDQIFVAGDGKTGLALALEKKPDILVTDMMLPGFSGTELIRQIREAGSKAEIIVITGNSDLELAISLFKYQVTEFIRKPFGGKELANTIFRVKQTVELRRENEEFRRRLIEGEKLQSVGLLAAGVAHEINNPNTFVKGNIELISRYLDRLIAGQDVGAQIRDLIAEALSGTERIQAIVSGLLSLSRPRARQKVKFRPSKAVKEALAITRHRRHQTQIALDQDDQSAPGAAGEAMGDPQAILQVLVNLVVNAMDAVEERFPSGAGGKIDISVRTEGDFQIVEVRDNGGGIPEGVKEKLFKPFFTTKGPGKGTGLGLSIAKTQVEESGGTLTFQSEQGLGTTFRLSLPVERQK